MARPYPRHPTDRRSCRARALVATAVAMSVVALCFGVLTDVAAAQPAQPPLEEFVPIDELPPEDRLPAAPFLIAAYSIVWILAFGYFWLLSRRFSDVERELADLSRRVGDDGDVEQP